MITDTGIPNSLPGASPQHCRLDSEIYSYLPIWHALKRQKMKIEPRLWLDSTKFQEICLFLVGSGRPACHIGRVVLNLAPLWAEAHTSRLQQPRLCPASTETISLHQGH